MRVTGVRTNLVRTVEDARRIVSVSPSNTEILFALGLGDRVVAVDRWSDYPPSVRDLPSVGSDLHADVEQIVAFEPDVVVASLHVPGMEDNLPRFEAAGLRYLALGGEGLDGVWDDVRAIGQYFARESAAEALIAEAQTRMARVAKATRQTPKRPRVQWEWSSHPYVAGKRSWITELLEMAGAVNVYDDLDTESARITVEEAMEHSPDVVVACWCGYATPPRPEVVVRRWRGKSPPVVVVNEDVYGRPGPRLAQGVEELARLLGTARVDIP